MTPFTTFCPHFVRSICSSSTLFLRFSSSIWIWASLSFYSKTRSLSDLHLSPFHFQLSATWNLTFPQLFGYHRPHDSHWVPDYKSLSQPLRKTCTMFSTGPGFSSTHPITNKFAHNHWLHKDFSSFRSATTYRWPPCKLGDPGTDPSPVIFQVTAHIPHLTALQQHVCPLWDLTQNWNLVVSKYFEISPNDYVSESPQKHWKNAMWLVRSR
jgi:hypothetical protein